MSSLYYETQIYEIGCLGEIYRIRNAKSMGDWEDIKGYLQAQFVNWLSDKMKEHVSATLKSSRL